MIMRIRNKQQKKRGFTLTEIAIVLGIVGLILGAIWVAAAAVYNNLRVSKASTELLTIVQNVRSMYANTSQVDANANMAIQAANAFVAVGKGTTYQQANIFPADMVTTTGNPVATVQILNPWNGDTDIESAKSVVADDSFSVNFDQVPTAACINFLTANTGEGRDPTMQSYNADKAGTLAFAAGAGVVAANALPSTPSAVRALCNTAASENVGFMFLLKG